eukprot:SAG11_NODE_12593_length_695_cov_1.255034_2_plen_31_part_01
MQKSGCRSFVSNLREIRLKHRPSETRFRSNS